MEVDSENIQEEYVLSICWDSGIIAASYFNIATLELFIVQEVTDLRPDYVQLRSIFRQIEPSYLVISSGSNVFLEEILELLDPTASLSSDINKYKVKKSGAANANTSNMAIYPFDRKNNLEALRKRIYHLNLPGMKNVANYSISDRQIFIDSVFPMNQELLVISLGNLLRYFSENYFKWRQVFLGLEKKLIVTNVINSVMQNMVLLDDTTFNSLNIFSNIQHPSSFKKQIRKDGLSLYNLLNNCCSSIGSQELKSILKQPTRDLTELTKRFNTIEWCMKKENEQHVQKIRNFLSGFVNINAVLQRIINSFGKTNDWKSFKRTVYHASSICELCTSFPDETIRNTLIEDLAAYCKDGLSVNGILFALDKIVDLEAVDDKKRFVVKKGLNIDLDRKREELSDFIDTCDKIPPDSSLQKIYNSIDAFKVVYFPEVGFLIGTNLKLNQMNLNQSLDENEIEVIFQTDDAVYFKTPKCKALNQKYDELMTEIITYEMEIFHKLIQYVNENFAELAEITKICAKLDCMISFARIAEKHKYIRPNVTLERKMEIIHGRHPLLEQIREYVPSSTIINEQNSDFINIIRAPNSSGKSIYVKQVALVCYMAHIGCFVPASENCNITQLHSIFTRIYTPESIYNNESAFMSDLQQVSRILMSSSDRSLLLIDEFGKGTHYKDGIALLTATIDHFSERGRDFVPYVFITTHYPQVYQLLQSKELVNLKTISTKKNDTNVFQSTYRIVDGVNEQVCTEFPESKKIIFNIFNNKERYDAIFKGLIQEQYPIQQAAGLILQINFFIITINFRDEELKIFNEAYNTSVKALILVLAKMMLRKNYVTYEFIKDIYSEVSIENFLNI